MVANSFDHYLYNTLTPTTHIMMFVPDMQYVGLYLYFCSVVHEGAVGGEGQESESVLSLQPSSQLEYPSLHITLYLAACACLVLVL